MKIKHPIKYNLILIRIATIEKPEITSIDEDVRNWNPCVLLIGM